MKRLFDGSKRILLFLFFFSVCFSTVAQAAENPLAYRPVVRPAEDSPVGEAPNLLVKVVSLPLSFYTHVLSRVDGDRCPSQPTCSLYARRAVDRHGAVLGLWMTVDRLIHERTEIVRSGKLGRVVRLKDGRFRAGDPLEASDFWLRDP